ncbi:M3 family metallopeptidase [Stenotrophomonas sp. GD03819]|uniref:M3 family metallopeptidase n=1 Tax=Stenotrophomonas TaxID=40323 RepID=UPI00070FEE3B|nr:MULTISPECIES: M3 family metallopeptidase [Stenotrophomonas]KRG40382.1 peptidase [Stenotrophomonas geniculata ATCC 19374 = JCM 13324]MDH1792788.1 M3 family metallopeptidase [Stenotrophomonas sp. GD03819]MDJ1521744.1 M3 family metallopeptidase [Stenotrophomonas maltophilia]
MQAFRKRTTTAAVVAVLAIAPFSGAQAQSVHADDRAYFANATAEQAARVALGGRVEALQQASTLAPAERFRQAEILEAQCLRHHGYLHLQAARNARDQRPAQALDQVTGLCSRIARSGRAALREAPADAAWAAPYGFLRARALKEAATPANAALDEAVEALADPALDSFARLRGQILRSAEYPQIEHGGRHWDTGRDKQALAQQPDRALREAGWKGYWQGLHSRREPMASVLLGLVQVNDAAARLQGDGSAPAHGYQRMGLDTAVVNATLVAVEQHAEDRRAYQEMLLHHAARSGIDAPQIWDTTVPDAGYTPPVLTLAQLRDNAADAMQHLGPAYVAELRALLDPANQRMDLATERGDRSQDAFPVSAPGVPAMLFVGVRRGDLESDVEIAHEAGHAMHGEWMQRGHASPLQRNGSQWLTEAFAIYNELRFRDQLYQQAQDPRAKAYYLKSLLDDMVLQLFTSSEEAQLEQSIYQGVAAGTLGTADDLDALTGQVLARFGQQPERYPQLRNTWIGKRLMYEDPNYLVNYLYAGLLAVQLYVQDQRDPDGFRERYLAVLGEGFDRAPDEQVAQLLGHAPDWAALVDADLQVFNQTVAQLQALHARIEAGQGT